MGKSETIKKSSNDLTERNWRLFFRVGLFVKLFDGVMGSIVGSAILILSKQKLTGIFVRLAKGELLEDPHDRLVRYIFSIFHSMSVAGKTFAGVYILSHGLLNVIMVIGLFKQKLWAYYVAFIFLGAFVIYQAYRYSTSHSGGIGLLTLFDLFFLIVTYHEYRYHKKDWL